MSVTGEGVYDRNEYSLNYGKSWEDKYLQNVVEGAEKSQTSQNFQGAVEANMYGSWGWTTSIWKGVGHGCHFCELSAKQVEAWGHFWSPRSASGTTEEQEQIETQHCPGANDNLQNIITAASLLPPRTHTASL